MADRINNDDLFIIGNQAEKKTYKTTYDSVQIKIQQDTKAVVMYSVDQPETLPNGSPLEDGALWYRPARNADRLLIYRNGMFVPVSGGSGTGPGEGVARIMKGDNIFLTPEIGTGTVRIDSVIKYPNEAGPVDPEPGDLWINMEPCLPKLMIYTDCLEDGPESIEIGPPDIQYVMEDLDGNVFVRGSVFCNGSLLNKEQKAPYEEGKLARIDQYGDLYVTGDVYVGENVSTAVFEVVTPVNALRFDEDGNLNIRGSLFCFGDVFSMLPG